MYHLNITEAFKKYTKKHNFQKNINQEDLIKTLDTLTEQLKPSFLNDGFFQGVTVLDQTGNASTSYDGNTTPVDFSPSGGGSRTTDGYSNVEISGLPSISNLRFRITLLNNATAERWLVDDFKVKGIVSTPQPEMNVQGNAVTIKSRYFIKYYSAIILRLFLFNLLFNHDCIFVFSSSDKLGTLLYIIIGTIFRLSVFSKK